MDLKDKMTEVAGTALKAADSGDRLESTDDKAKSQMLSASVGLVIKCQVLLYKKSYIKMYNYSDAWI